jgi:hypothetical protein
MSSSKKRITELEKAAGLINVTPFAGVGERTCPELEGYRLCRV